MIVFPPVPFGFEALFLFAGIAVAGILSGLSDQSLAFAAADESVLTGEIQIFVSEFSEIFYVQNGFSGHINEVDFHIEVIVFIGKRDHAGALNVI